MWKLEEQNQSEYKMFLQNSLYRFWVFYKIVSYIFIKIQQNIYFSVKLLELWSQHFIKENFHL